jgi:hypothetical protein
MSIFISMGKLILLLSSLLDPGVDDTVRTLLLRLESRFIFFFMLSGPEKKYVYSMRV